MGASMKARLLDELLSVEKEFPGGSDRSYQIRKEIQALTGEPATTGAWLTGFWRVNKLYGYFGWPYPTRWQE